MATGRLHADPTQEALRQHIERCRSSAASRQAHKATGRTKTRAARKGAALREYR